MCIFICVVLLLFVCDCVLPQGDNPIAVNKMMMMMMIIIIIIIIIIITSCDVCECVYFWSHKARELEMTAWNIAIISKR
jgi:hypothetical protein